ncbi:F0F1 ATP synthase subunit delta [Thiopseudomonas acetoxidans]|uniref:ATP synthase subunit delta n=1 Tax=Thiopseudomonas acetoxidans TaxID=3041622 RepID=A0ABT7SMU5_9GAMM|nr:F0F1 ATP synthase subunit delta [Thiopseudomonas sp. CY1220]MDM7857518.1 F0F1 ATP synthase subunit delta [Thiopseudomonas sp. CY1220]
MSNSNTLARPYAKAAFEYAATASKEEAWSNMLSFAATAVAQAEVVKQLGNPELNKKGKVTFLIQLCEGNVDNEFSNFLHLLGENDRLTLLPTIYEIFTELKADKNRSLDVEVESAFELSAAQLKTLAAALSKRLDRTVHPKATVNPALIGGLHIRAGDLVIDGSIRGKLNKLAEALKS